jgi:hypothetical protein
MLFPILWAGFGLACFLFASRAPATVAPDARRSSSAPGNADSASAGAAQVRNIRIKAERTGDPGPALTGAQSSAASRGRTSAAVAPRRGFVPPQHGTFRSAGGSGDAFRAPPSAQARGSKRNALTVPKAAAMPRNSPLGGPREQRIGRLDGAAFGRITHGTAIDGTQFRRKL